MSGATASVFSLTLLYPIVAASGVVLMNCRRLGLGNDVSWTIVAVEEVCAHAVGWSSLIWRLADSVARRAAGGPPKAEPAADAGPAARSRAALI